MERPSFSASATLQFVVNGKAGSSDADAVRDTIESELRNAGRTGIVHFAAPGELPRVARECARKALKDGSVVVAVGGDGTVNTVAQAAHAVGCAMGVLPQGTFNYFAREHGLPTETAEALRALVDARPEPVQVSAVNDRVFLVNTSLGLHPEVLQDRERWKSRFGRSRLVALGAGVATLLRAQDPLRLLIDFDGSQRKVRTLTLFVGNNRMQLEKLGLTDAHADAGAADGHVTAVILKPVGTMAMFGLMLRGALGQLGDAGGVEHFACQKLVVEPAFSLGRRKVKVAFDGEVEWLKSPLAIRVLPEPLWLLKVPAGRTNE
jgi:diacylglycerol kinase family enzyme